MGALGSSFDLHDLFVKLDVNHDGLLTRVEATTNAIQTMQAAGTAQLAMDFGRLDTTLDGQLNQEEFVAGLAQLGAEEELKALFRRLDVNHDGQITKLEAIRGNVASTATDTSGGVVPTLTAMHSALSIGLNNLAWIAGHNGSDAHADASAIYSRLAGALMVRSENRNGSSFPTFAGGGMHAGGARIVGEFEPELEVTGPARIYNGRQMRSLLSGGGDNSELVAEMRSLRADVTRLLERGIVVQAEVGRQLIGSHERVAVATEDGNKKRLLAGSKV
jgi:hypothetical protein